LRRPGAGLLVIDIQERLLPAMWEPDRVVANARRLVEGANILGVPVFVTEQYRRGLGPTVPAIADVIPGFAPVEKLVFSAGDVPGIAQALPAHGVESVLLCGIEAHVCVCQTALDLIANGYRVFVAGDATSSRTPANHQAALDRLRSAGAVPVSTEMALFELLGEAGTEDFKRILALVR
jgi:nicotinamidase-related amidase